MDTTVPSDDFPLQRHGCLTAWIGATLFFSAVGIVITLLAYAPPKQVFSKYSPFVVGVIIACALVRIVSTIALLKWRKWGFYGVVCVDIIASVINLSLGFGFGQSLFGLLNIGTLYWLLKIGKEKAWDFLR